MNWLRRGKFLLLPFGGALLLIGAALSIFAHSHGIKVAAAALVVVGMVSLRLSGPGTVRRVVYTDDGARAGRSWINGTEAVAYAVAALALIATFIAAANKIFDDRLTYTLFATVLVATAFYICRRILRLF